jgi:hypothetical protein
MEIDFAEVADNYSLLEQEEKVMIREAMNGPVREVIAKVFGAEFNNMLGQFATAEPAPKRGLAAR